jgi:hypothetical protein
MFPGMVYAILSRDPDFVDDMSVLLRLAGGEVYAASSWDEYARLQEEGVQPSRVAPGPPPAPGGRVQVKKSGTAEIAVPLRIACSNHSLSLFVSLRGGS